MLELRGVTSRNGIQEEEKKMPVQTGELEPVEPQSLKKLSLKSLKRTLDLFSPVHGLLAPPDPERSLLISQALMFIFPFLNFCYFY